MPPVDYSIKNIEEVVRPHLDGTIRNADHARLTAPGENYLSLVLRVDFEVDQKGLRKKVSTVAKRIPMGDQQHMIDMHCQTMHNEIKWYKEIVPLLVSFGEEYGVKVDIFPKCLGARYSLDPTKKRADSESVLVLENLHPEGYGNADRYIGFDLTATKAILKKLALFHVLPIAVKTNKPESFETLKRYLDEAKPRPPPKDGDKPPHGPPGMKPGEKKPEEMLLEAVKNLPECGPYILKIEDVLKRCKMGPMEEFHLAEEPWNTMVHGDVWVNNIMVKEDRKGVHVKLVDFQMMRYGSFGHDLVFFLLSSVRNDVLKEHIDELLKFYHEEFNSLLRQFRTNLELPYELFLDMVKETAYSNEVGHSLTFCTVIFGEKGTGVDVAVEGHDFFALMRNTLSNMNSYHKEKLVHIAAESVRKGWI
ncbi:uncharacterized protein LOC126736408 [Anthonomus grandis grandis]|uniref:uncharacterized protein LOC126736408 n=1 Tax=Anthonomus grandis grandis TaxID=2921223 RepID=UPI0021661E2D|nr:uncharacterized protein LOC126736408 [Anthonomus grandis grandis]